MTTSTTIKIKPEIKTANVRLRLLAADDLAMTLAWRNRDEVRQWLGNAAELAMPAHQAWFRAHQALDNAFMFIVEDAFTAAPLGQVSIYEIDREMGTAEVGRFIAAPGVSGKGLIREAIAALINFAFDEMNLNELLLLVMAHNHRAIKLYASLGFIQIFADAAQDATSMITMTLKKSA